MNKTPASLPIDELEASLGPTAPNKDTYVLFTVDTNTYALPVRDILAVLAYPAVTRIPTSLPHVLGVFHHRGRIVPLFDLHILFATDGPPPERPNLLIATHDDQVFGLAVDDIDEVITIDTVEVVTPPTTGLPEHIAPVVQGWLRVIEPDDTPDADRDVDRPASQSIQKNETDPPADARPISLHGTTEERSHATGTPVGSTRDKQEGHERAKILLSARAPVLLLDAARLKEAGRGSSISEWEVTHGRS
jgi:chemotaxis signal transduction protein